MLPARLDVERMARQAENERMDGSARSFSRLDDVLVFLVEEGLISVLLSFYISNDNFSGMKKSEFDVWDSFTLYGKKDPITDRWEFSQRRRPCRSSLIVIKY